MRVLPVRPLGGAVGPGRLRWFEWSEEAFRKAQDEDRPIFLFLTAAWCQGGRILEETVLESEEVAEILGRDYVPVRVDADRHPDLNDRYNMGGWPSLVFLLPSGESLGGTTFVGREQMPLLLRQVRSAYQGQKARIAGELARREGLRRERDASANLPGVAALSLEIFRKTVRGILATFDLEHAGFGRAPKYPMTASLRVVLQAYFETGGPDFEQVLIRTLDAMSRGMYDAEEGGFFRYSTNDSWTAARTEKIGEDNAELIRLYLDSATVTEEDRFAARARHALEWVRRRLYDPRRGVFGGSQAGDEEYYLVPASERSRRPPPPVDPTVYVPACSAMVSACLRAAQVLGEREYEEMALRALDFLLRECVRDGKVAHYHDGEPRGFHLARDRIALGTALLDALEATGDPRYERAAREMADALVPSFWSEEPRGIVDRQRGPGDCGEAARPLRSIAENGRAAEFLARLWRRGAGEAYGEWARRILLAWPDFLDGYGHFTAEYALASDWLVRPPVEIRVGAPALREVALRPYLPRRVVRFGAGGTLTVVRRGEVREASTAEEAARILEGP